jgi:hypothetical protein
MVLQFVGEYVAAFLLKNPSSKMKGFFVRSCFSVAANKGSKQKPDQSKNLWVGKN